MRNVIVYIAASVDGYIAAPGDDLSFLSLVEKPGEDYGYARFIQDVDTVIVGRRTYDKLMTMVDTFPHHDKTCYIITHTPRLDAGNIHYYSGELKPLIHELQQQQGKNIFVDGGSEIIHALLKDNLVDEFYISTIPVMLGGGTPLFREGRPMHKLELKEVTSYDTGLVQAHYVKKLF